MSNKILLLPRSIRDTIDHLPSGICFSTLSGRLILSNAKMNELVFKLTGHTVLNANTSWEEMRNLESSHASKILDNSWARYGFVNHEEADNEFLFFVFEDNVVWQFCRKTLKEQKPQYIQIDANDITDLYRLSEELHDNNERLVEQQKRQRNLLANIDKINRDKEMLSAKIKIHDDLGRCIILTRQHLEKNIFIENVEKLNAIWITAILELENFKNMQVKIESSPEIELAKAADIIGCHIYFYGDRPAGRRTNLLLYATVREALTNAVMHAQADRLNVNIITAGDRGYRIEISDNGGKKVENIVEGSGLGNLRKRLELEGAGMQIKLEDGVVLIVELPMENIDSIKQRDEII